jgi:hypothetical protein
MELSLSQEPKEEDATGSYLSNKVADNTAIINAHARTISVKNSSNPHLNTTQITIKLAYS